MAREAGAGAGHSGADGLTGAVLAALAGARRGEPVAVVGAPERAERAVLAASGREAVTGGARLALAGAAVADVRAACDALQPGGRLVALAADAAAARALAEGLGLRLRHVEPVPGGVALAAVVHTRAASGPGPA